MLARHQLAAYSPLTAGALASAIGGRVLHGADELDQVRSLVASEYDAEAVVLVDSGRSALRLAIEAALPRKPARRVVALPAFQCFEVATAAVGVDCEIALYDVDPATLAPDLASLEQALRQGAPVVVVAPLYGLPVDWSAITALVNQHGAIAIEDAAQGIGADWEGRRLGSLGDLSVVSFGRGKGWTGGGGGALLGRRDRGRDGVRTAEASLQGFELPRELLIAAVAALQLVLGRPSLYGIPAGIPSLGLGETRYHDPTPPRAMSSFSAALMRRTLDDARRESEVRQRTAAIWIESLPKALTPGMLTVRSGGGAGYLRFPLRLRADSAALANERSSRRLGIAPSYPLPLGALAAVAPKLLAPGARYPGAATLVRELVTLPTHSLLTRENREAILALAARWHAPDAR